MTSIFLKDRDRAGPRVPFIVLEAWEAAQVGEPVTDAAGQYDLLRAAATRAGVDWSDDDLVHVFRRLVDRAAPGAAAAPPEAVKIGRAIAGYLEDLTPEGLCVLAAGYDLERARLLYCEQDFEVVQGFAAECVRRTMVDFYALHEAVAVGFGGVPEDGDSKPASGPSGRSVATADVGDLNNRLGFLRGTRH